MAFCLWVGSSVFVIIPWSSSIFSRSARMLDEMPSSDWVSSSRKCRRPPNIMSRRMMRLHRSPKTSSERLKYEGAAAYRQSWDEWQPDTQGEGQFDLKDLSVTVGADVAFAHCFIKCGGILPNGKTFEDLVRATFCLRKASGSWKVAHQHISKPIQLAGA